MPITFSLFHYHSRCARIVAVITCIPLLVAGCDSAETPSNTQGEMAYGPAPSTTPQTADSPPPALPGVDNLSPGAVEIRLSGSGVHVIANRVSQGEILSRLAEKAGFEFRDTGVDWDVVNVSIRGDALHPALVELLRPHPYRIVYRHVPGQQAEVLWRVVAGSGDAGVAESGLLQQLDDASAAARKQAAEAIEPEGRALERLTQVLLNDPEADVRAAAAENLQHTEDPRAVAALLAAMEDEQDSRVMVEIIESLGFIGDPQAMPSLRLMLEHQSEAVRDAAEDALGQLE